MKICYNAGGKTITSCIFAKDSLFAVSYEHGSGPGRVFIIELDLHDDGTLRERRCVPIALPDEPVWDGERNHPQFLALDETGSALWLNTKVGLLVLPMHNLQPETCCLWKDLRVAEPRKRLRLLGNSVLFDTATRDVYILFDASRCCYDAMFNRENDEDVYDDSPCYVRRLAPSQKPAGKPWQVGTSRQSSFTQIPPTEWKTCSMLQKLAVLRRAPYIILVQDKVLSIPVQIFLESLRAPLLSNSQVSYPDLPGDYVCSAEFTIDGFSDSFCISASCLLRSTPQRLQVGCYQTSFSYRY